MTEDAGSNNRRIARNAVMLYIRMGLSMIVGLYTSRVVLATLGVSDYGIYGVVGGIVGMMGFLNSSMAGATSRFITFELGRGDEERLRKTFSSALIVHFGISLVILLLAETVGLWFLENKLVIPEGRMDAARWVYQLSILSAVISIPQAPYSAVLIAHEKMDIYAYFELLNVGLKLLIVYLLQIGDFDKLILYAVLTFAVSVFMIMLYRLYCIRHYSEARFRWIWDKTYLRPLLSFSGWDLYAQTTFTFRTYGGNFLLNIFYGVIYNAANGIASTLQGVLLGFASNIVGAFSPQITKNYAQRNIDQFNHLICLGVKFSYLAILLVSAPLLFETEYLLQLWLGQVPEGSVLMTRLLLVTNIFNTCSYTLKSGIHATGKITFFSIFCGTIYLVNIPIMYLLLKSKVGYASVHYVIMVTSIIILLSYCCVLKQNERAFRLRYFFESVLLRLVLITLLTLGAIYLMKNSMCYGLFRLTGEYVVTGVILFTLSYLILLNKSERFHLKRLALARFPLHGQKQ